MSSFGRVSFVVLLFAGMLFATRLALPSRVGACSCVRLGPIGDLANDPAAVIVAGTVVDVQQNQQGSQLGQFVIQRIFKGPVGLPPQVPIIGGDMCSFGLEENWHGIFVASIEQGRLTPRPCSLAGDLGTPEGQALLREVEAAFGPAPPGVDQSTPTMDLALIAILLISGIVTVVLFGVLFLAIGRRDRTAAP